MDVYAITWSAADFAEGLVSGLRHCRLALSVEAVRSPSIEVVENEQRMGVWIEESAQRLGVDVEPNEFDYSDICKVNIPDEPTVFRLAIDHEVRFAFVIRHSKRYMVLWTPNHREHRVSVEWLKQKLCCSLEETVKSEVEQVVGMSPTSDRRRESICRAVYQSVLADVRLGTCWVMRCSPGTSLRLQLRQSGLIRLMASLVFGHLIASALYMTSWWLLGGMLLSGHLELSWVLLWGLLLMSIIPFRAMGNLAEGEFSLLVGLMLRRQTLRGAMALNRELVTRMGPGQLLGQVLELETVELSTMTGIFHVVQSIIDLSLVAVMLCATSQHFGLLLALIVCLCLCGYFAVRYHSIRRRWTERRLAMTGDLVEKLAGHRTRRIQEALGCGADREDELLASYLASSCQLDQALQVLRVIIPRGWMMAGFAVMLCDVVYQATLVELAVGVGATLVVAQGLRGIASSVDELSAAAIAWKKVRPFWDAARVERASSDPEVAASGGVLATFPSRTIDAVGITYRYDGQQHDALSQMNGEVKRGERVIVDGPSGCGKSTLVGLLGGTKQPTGGALLLNGLDYKTWGDRLWGRRVAVVPQYHENYLLNGSMLWNARLGCESSPSDVDLHETERVLRGLSLGDVLDRMPSGLMQTVGETGWQLSHGERSRLFVARALLQKPEIVVLDESFAALDPETLETTMNFVASRCETLVVVAHP